MFPHDKLDWHMTRLDRRLEKSPEDLTARLEYATTCLSKAWWHQGGEVWFNHALTQARRILQQDPSGPGALVVAGASLLGLGRTEPAARYLDEALRVAADRADVHLSMAEMHRQNNDLHQAVREAEIACRLAPQAWESHLLLSQLLWNRAQQLGSGGRLAERSQFHTVRALQLGASGPLVPPMLYDLAIACMHTGRFADAHKLFHQLLEDDRHRDRAQYYLGLVSYQLGKYKNAVMYLRQHLQKVGDKPKVLSRLGLCYLQLGEVAKARETCNRALALDPTELQARWTLGCALVEEGREDDAIRIFKQILEDAPDHAATFEELVRIRSAHGDRNWLQQALHTEVARYDHLPKTHATARDATRARIDSISRSLGSLGNNASAILTRAMDLTQNEGLRFALWEAAVGHRAAVVAQAISRALQEPGRMYSAALGREVLAVSDRLPEALITRGLDLSDDDLRRAAMERHGNTSDVSRHRAHIDEERREARAWQALLLLSLGARGNTSSKSLLRRWADEADDDLADAARASLTLLGDAKASQVIQRRARARGAADAADAFVTHIDPPRRRFHPRPADPDGDQHCATCGRRAAEVGHLLQGGNDNLCDGCMAELARDRRHLATEDPDVRCHLCDQNHLEARNVYVFRAVPVCSGCLDTSLGLAEREEIERYLAAL